LGLECVDLDHLEPPPDLPIAWVELRASFGADAGASCEELMTALDLELGQLGLAEPGGAPLAARLCWIDDKDWANNWKAHFTPVRVGRFLIHPGWDRPDPQARWPVRIDPGLAFGTGMHPTGVLVLSGLLTDEATAVSAAFVEERMRLLSSRDEAGWTALSLARVEA